MTSLEKARQRLAANPLRHANMLDALHLGAEVLAATDESTLLYLDQLCYISADTAQAAKALLPLPADTWGAVLHDSFLLDTLTESGFSVEMRCVQAVYTGKEPLPVRLPENVSIRPLTREDLPYVLKNYRLLGDNPEHLQGRIDAGMLGACVDGVLRGFIGAHAEGGIGILFVAPEARRLGLASALEASMVNRFLAEGRLPFGQVETKNEPSLQLQKRLGMTFWDGTIYWLLKRA